MCWGGRGVRLGAAPEPQGSIADQIRVKLNAADQAFRDADEAQRAGNTVKWARLMEEGRVLVSQAVDLSRDLPADNASESPSESASPSADPSESPSS